MKLLILTLFSILFLGVNNNNIDFKYPFCPEDCIRKYRRFGKQPIPIGVSHAVMIDFKGIVYEVANNTPVLSIANGTVKECGNRITSGQYILIEHDNNVLARYYHLGSVYIEEGQQIVQGQEIGTSSTCGHVIFNSIGIMIWKDGEIIDPSLLLE